MLRTETEASEKWCPFARIWSYTESPNGGSGAYNRHPDGGSTNGVRAGCNCIASDCMAWQWFDREGTPDQDKNLEDRIDGKPTVPLHVPQEQRRGYCGLAGMPAQV